MFLLIPASTSCFLFPICYTEKQTKHCTGKMSRPPRLVFSRPEIAKLFTSSQARGPENRMPARQRGQRTAPGR
jgi:hypothetical protein